MNADVIFEDKDAIYTINQVASIIGVHAQTLRNWERSNLIAPERITGDQRIYRGADLKRIEEIQHLKNKGWNNKAIQSYFEDREPSSQN